MANFNGDALVFQASEYEHALAVGGQTFPFNTLKDATRDNTQDSTNIWAIGASKPIAVKVSGQNYSGSFTMQAGEYDNLIRSLKTVYPSVQDLLDISYEFAASCTLVRFNKRNGASKKFIGVKFNKDGDSISNNSVETVTSISFMCTSYENIV